MRKALNDNPVVQIVVLVLLGIVVAFLLLTKVVHKSGSSGAPTTTTGSPTASSPTSGTSTTSTTPSAGATPPATTAPGSAVTGSGSGGEAIGEFVAGPGLPAPVVHAYKSDKTVVLLVLRRRGIDDREVRAEVENLRARGDLALFVTNAGRIARYSRITQGVNVNRVPALVVMRPRRLSHGTPTASVSYGYRDADGVVQAVRDALYKGPTNLPYYPQ
jgi:hypothetical protein